MIPNWGPVEEVWPGSKTNRWSVRLGLNEREVVLYSGTLGLKHDPSILLAIADRMSQVRPAARMVVISEGKGRDWLERQKAIHATGLPQLLLLDFQPYEDLGDVLATADVLVAVLDPAASQFSVPSKVLTYLCAGRPIVGFLPSANDAAHTIAAAGGVVVAPGAIDQGANEIFRVLEGAELRERMCHQSREVAERTFDMSVIASNFERAFAQACMESPR